MSDARCNGYDALCAYCKSPAEADVHKGSVIWRMCLDCYEKWQGNSAWSDANEEPASTMVPAPQAQIQTNVQAVCSKCGTPLTANQCFWLNESKRFDEPDKRVCAKCFDSTMMAHDGAAIGGSGASPNTARDAQCADAVGGSKAPPAQSAVPTVLEEAAALVNGDRRKAYGPVEESFVRIAAVWSVVLKRPITGREVALCMLGLKLCREANAHKRDNLIDAAAYAHLAQVMAEAEGGAP